MSNQIVISSGAKVRSLEGVLTGTSGIVNSVPLGGANGVATLDSNGKVPLSQLPASVVTYLGTWNAATNTPTLANGTGDVGDLYICNVAGTVNFGAGPITFAVGDWVIYNGSEWQKSSGATGTVTSVAVTSTGNDAISITGSPITTAGTINIGFTGTSAQYVNGAGDLTTFPSLTGYVPYTGATTDVDLGVHVLNAQALHVKGTAGAGHLGLKHQSAAATGSTNESLIYANVDGDLAWQNDNLYLTTLSTHANTANRVYTFPDLTGTMAMLEGTQTFSGAKTFSVSVNNDDGLKIKLGSASNLTTGYLTLSAYGETTPLPDRTILRIGTAATQMSLFKLQNTGSYTYDFPASSGTIALTSNLSSYVPYTGATSDVNLGTTYSLSANNITAAGVVKSDFGLQLKSGLTTTISGYLSISAQKVSTNSQLNVYTDTGFYFSLIAPNTANYSYTYPASSGTLVLGTGTTNYLPKFTGASTIGNSLIFDNGSSLGISTTTLVDKLTINGGIALTQTGAEYIYSNGGTGGAVNAGFYFDGTNNAVRLYTNNTEKMRVTSSGNVGIGATPTDFGSSYTVLDVYNGTVGGYLLARSPNVTGQISVDNNTAMYVQTRTNHPIVFALNNSEKMRITSSGRVGIGRTSPGTALSVAGQSEQWQLALSTDTGAGAVIGSPSANVLAFGDWSGTERMRIASNGAVTISSDTYPILSVSSTQALSAGNFDIWNFLAPNQTGGAISFNIGKALATYNNAALKFYYAGNNSSSNSLGIGFYDGDNRFNIRADGLLTATGPTSPFNFNPGGRIMYVNSSGQIGSNPSTRESKININPISDVSYIYNLNPVSFYFRKTNMETYEYTDEYYDEIRYGFIADEVEPLNTDLVSYNVNEDGTKKMAGVEYISMIPVLVKALQEQKKLIDEISAKVTALENK